MDEVVTRRKRARRMAPHEAVKVYPCLNKPGLEFDSWDAVVAFVQKETGVVASTAGLYNLRKTTGLTFRIRRSYKARTTQFAAITMMQARLDRLETMLEMSPLPAPPTTDIAELLRQCRTRLDRLDSVFKLPPLDCPTNMQDLSQLS